MTAHTLSCSCGACSLAGGVLTSPENRPSLPTLAYRRGSFSSIRAAILQDIGVANGRTAVIRDLTARTDDHAITLAELWAAVGDVLGFYSERYANEAFLGTATQPRSVERLARLVGYRRRPGIAALAWLAFDAEPGSVVSIAGPIKVQSVPGPPPPEGPPLPPQIFETLHPTVVDARLNRIHAYTRPRPAQPFGSGVSTTILRRGDVGNAATTLRPRDRVALWGAAANEFETAEVAAVVEAEDHVRIEWAAPLRGAAGADPQVRVTTRLLRAFGAAAPPTWIEPQQIPNTNPPSTHWVFRLLGSTIVVAGTTSFDIDAKADDITQGTEIVVLSPGVAPHLARVTAVGTATPKVGPLSDTVTRLEMSPALPSYNRAEVALHVVSGPPIMGWDNDYSAARLGASIHVPVWSAPPEDGRAAVEIGRRVERHQWQAGDVLTLDALTAGKTIIVEPDQPQASGVVVPGPLVFHLAADAALPAFDATGFGHLRLDLIATDDDKAAAADWPAVSSLWVRGNVARASHGETVVETLGDGDAARPFQRFALGKKPLTFVPSPSAGGVATTLSAFVDGVRRDEVRTLYGQPPSAPVVETATRPDGTTFVLSGDDRTGARFTSGSGNVTARYRVGSGLAGRVGPQSLTTLLTKPVGLSAVVNPLAAEGGADPEHPSTMRSQAPASVRALGRAVSLRDIEDLLLLSGNVAKAQAVWLSNGLERCIHVTVAAPGDGPLSASLRASLVASLDSVRETSVRIAIDDARRIGVELKASVVVDRRAIEAAQVLAAVDTAARSMLGFSSARLGYGIALSDVIAGLAAVPLVVGVDVDGFGFVPGQLTTADMDAHGLAMAAGQPLPVQPKLRSLRAQSAPLRGNVVPAELLLASRPEQIAISDGGLG
jgi:hypothetical protein